MGTINGFDVAGATSFIIGSFSFSNNLETIVASQSISAGTFKANDIILVEAASNKGSNAGAMKLYWNTSPTTSGAVQIAIVTPQNSYHYTPLFRRIAIINDTTTLVYKSTTPTENDLGRAGTTDPDLTTITTINWNTDGYLILTIFGNSGQIINNYLKILV